MLKSLSGSYARTLLAIGLVALLVQGVSAHTYLSSVVLGGQALAEGDCVRPHPSTAFDSPIPLVTSPDMTCGWLPNAAQPANRNCPIAAGSSIGIQWHHNSDAATDDILDPSHVGPILFYLAKSSDGSGPVWFKIWEDGYDQSTKKWATDRMIANKGLNTITIPSDIAPGNYLLRGEVLALHNAYNLDGVQPYVGCVQLTISGSGSANPAGVAFPGAYSDTDPGILINVYQTIPNPYVIPGPAVYVSGSGSSSSGASAPTSAPTSAPNQPTSAPTSAPAQPTSAPNQPTYAPTNPPSNPSTGSSSGSTGGSLQVAMNSGSNTWWLGVVVSGGSEATTNVEITDSGAVTSWTALQQLPYAWVYSRSVQLTLPISVRLTSASGKQVTYTNVLTAWGQTTPSGSSDYGSAGTAPETSSGSSKTAPTSPANPVTPAPTNAPAGNAVTVTQYSGSNMWWFAVTVDSQDIASVELKDSASVSSFAFMTYAPWGYSLSAMGTPFVAPLTVRITNEAGQAVTATIPSITPGATATAQ